MAVQAAARRRGIPLPHLADRNQLDAMLLPQVAEIARPPCLFDPFAKIIDISLALCRIRHLRVLSVLDKIKRFPQANTGAGATPARRRQAMAEAEWKRLQRGESTLGHTLAIGSADIHPQMHGCGSGFKPEIDDTQWQPARTTEASSGCSGHAAALEPEPLAAARDTDTAGGTTRRPAGVALGCCAPQPTHASQTASGIGLAPDRQ